MDFKTFNWTSEGNRYLNVEAYDQYGIDITDRCNVTYEGNYVILDNGSLILKGNSLTIFVSLGENTLKRNLSYEENSKKSFVVLIILITFLIIILFMITILIYLYYQGILSFEESSIFRNKKDIKHKGRQAYR